MASTNTVPPNFGDGDKVATVPSGAVNYKLLGTDMARNKKKKTSAATSATKPKLPPQSTSSDTATERPSTPPTRPTAERHESSHEYTGAGEDATPKSPIRGHIRTASQQRKDSLKRSSAEGLGNGHAGNSATNGNGKTFADAVVNGVDGAAEYKTNGHSKEEEDTGYPPLYLAAQGRSRHERHALRAGGIRFAPLKIPFERRLQMGAVLFHSLTIAGLVALFFFFAAIPLTWPLLVPYLIHLSFSTVASDGSLRYRSEFMRSLPIWKLFAGYFPAELHKTHDLDPTRKYIFGYHPHGIISHGGWVSFATNALGFSEKFPGITNTLLTLDSNFRIPFYRDWIIGMGIRSVSKESIWNTLTRGGANNEGMGRAVTIVIGGARESLEAQPGQLRLIINGRKGFIKMALRTGADLVPVLAFGENDLYDQLSPKTHPLVRKFQIYVLRVFKFTLPALHGRGILNYDVGMMPYRRPLNIVVGKPIKVTTPGTPQPEQADIDRLHELYVAEVQKLWDAYKDQFAKDRTAEMQFIA